MGSGSRSLNGSGTKKDGSKSSNAKSYDMSDSSTPPRGSKLRELARELREADDWEEDSQVNVHVHAPAPKTSKPPMVVQVLPLLPPWGRVIVALALIGAAVWSGHAVGWY